MAAFSLEELEALKRGFEIAAPPLGDWRHSPLSDCLHDGPPNERTGGFESLDCDSLTGISVRIDDMCEVEVEQAEDNLYALLAAANAAPALLAEVLALRKIVDMVRSLYAALDAYAQTNHLNDYMDGQAAGKAVREALELGSPEGS